MARTAKKAVKQIKRTEYIAIYRQGNNKTDDGWKRCWNPSGRRGFLTIFSTKESAMNTMKKYLADYNGMPKNTARERRTKETAYRWMITEWKIKKRTVIETEWEEVKTGKVTPPDTTGIDGPDENSITLGWNDIRG